MFDLTKGLRHFPNFGRRLVMTVFGVLLCAASIALFNTSAFGVDPFTSFVMGVSHRLGARYDVVYTSVNVVLLCVAAVVAKRLLGIATLLTVFVSGSVTQGCMWLMEQAAPNPSLALRVVLLVIGITVMCLASSLYYTANLGVSGYDVVALTWNAHVSIPFRYCRIATDAFCVTVGFLCGASIGIGTWVTACFMGPLIDVFNAMVSRPLLRAPAGRIPAKTEG